MAGVELCKGCLRENEEEVADQWCNDCSEAVCRGCGKAHRRFAVAHDVILIKDAPACRKNIPKNCLSHDNKKYILFCVGHDMLICHECLSEHHRTCKNILEIDNAAVGVKDSAAITDLKDRMKKLTNSLEKIQIENEQQLSKISAEKDSAVGHIKEFLQHFTYHILKIENNLNTKHKQIEKQRKENAEQFIYLRKNLQENMDWLCMLEGFSSESNIFHAVKHIDTILVSNEKQIDKMNNGLIRVPLDVLPPECMKHIDKFFQDIDEKTKVKTMLTRDYTQSQMKVKRANKSPPPSSQELQSDNKSTFGAFCFTDDDRMVVEESVRLTPSNALIHYLRIFDLKTSQSKQIKLSEIGRINLTIGSICMYDASLVLLASAADIRGVKVIDIKLKRICRTIYPKGSNDFGKICQIKWMSCKDQKIVLLLDFYHGERLCSIDFNGTILSEISLSSSVADLDFDGLQSFFYTDKNGNDIKSISFDIKQNEKCYSSPDLREGCSILHVVDDEVLLLDKNTKTVYKLDVTRKRRSILIQNDIVDPSHFNVSRKLKKFAIMMDGGKRIKIFPLILGFM